MTISRHPAPVSRAPAGPFALLCLLAALLMPGPAAALVYHYDDIGRLSSVAYDDGGSITYDYDPAGNIVSVQVSDTPATDRDGDGVPDGQDNCRDNANPDQLDTDHDGQGNVCDDDDDNDGLSDSAEAALGTDPLDPDTDHDGVNDQADAFPLDPDLQQGDATPPSITFFEVAELGTQRDGAVITADMWARAGQTVSIGVDAEDDLKIVRAEIAYQIGDGAWVALETYVNDYSALTKNSFEWVLPAAMATTPVVRVRATVYDVSGASASVVSLPFAVYANNGSLSVSAPATQFKLGDTLDLGTSYSNEHLAQSLQVWLECGARVEKVLNVQDAVGFTPAASYPLTVPTNTALVSSQCRFHSQIDDIRSNRIVAYSDYFRVTPNTDLPAPFGNLIQAFTLEAAFPADAQRKSERVDNLFVELDDAGNAHLIVKHKYSYYRDTGAGTSEEDTVVGVSNTYYVRVDGNSHQADPPVLVADYNFEVADLSLLNGVPYVLLKDAAGKGQWYLKSRTGAQFGPAIPLKNPNMPTVASTTPVGTSPVYDLARPGKTIYANGYLWLLSQKYSQTVRRYPFNNGVFGAEQQVTVTAGQNIARFGDLDSNLPTPVVDGHLIYYVDYQENASGKPMLVRFNTDTLTVDGFFLPAVLQNNSRWYESAAIGVAGGSLWFVAEGRAYVLNGSGFTDVGPIAYQVDGQSYDYSQDLTRWRREPAPVVMEHSGRPLIIVRGAPFFPSSIYTGMDMIEYDAASNSFQRSIASAERIGVQCPGNYPSCLNTGGTGVSFRQLDGSHALAFESASTGSSPFVGYTGMVWVINLDTGDVQPVGEIEAKSGYVNLLNVGGTFYSINENRISSYSATAESNRVVFSNLTNRREYLRFPQLLNHDQRLFLSWTYGGLYDGRWAANAVSSVNEQRKATYRQQVAPTLGSAATVASDYPGNIQGISDTMLAGDRRKLFDVNTDLSNLNLLADISGPIWRSTEFHAFNTGVNGVGAGLTQQLGQQYQQTLFKPNLDTVTLASGRSHADIAAFADRVLVMGVGPNYQHGISVFDPQGTELEQIDIASSGSANNSAINRNKVVAYGWGRNLALGSFAADLIPPTVSVNTLPSVAYTGQDISIGWQAADNNDELVKIELFKVVNGAPPEAIATLNDVSLTSFAYTPVEQAGDSLKFLVVATDFAGLETTATSTVISVAEPVIISDFHANKSSVLFGNKLLFLWTASGTEHVPARILQRHAGTTPWTEVLVVPAGVSAGRLLVDLPPGSYEFRLELGSEVSQLAAPISVLPVPPVDSDGDGVSDTDELAAGTDPTKADSDGDGIDDDQDAFPLDPTEYTDSDADGIGDNRDNCPTIANSAQTNTDGDADGDVCDRDDDNDGLSDSAESALGTDPKNPDSDGDGVNDNLDAFPLDATETADSDNDGVGDEQDNCPSIANSDQSDSDSNGLGDACDTLSTEPEATITLSADNAEEAWLNGDLLGISGNWFEASGYIETLKPGVNVLAVKASDAGGIAAMIAQLQWDDQIAVSDTSWKVARSAPSGWESPGFDDSQWLTATNYGAYGTAPWFKRIAGFPDDSTAQWIWTSDNSGDDTAYFRYRFTVATTRLAIEPAALQDGQLGQSYSLDLNVISGSAPYSWVLSSGALPSGLNLDPVNGTLSGTPSQAGSANFTVQVTDNAGAVGEKTYDLSILSNVSLPPEVELVVSGDNSEEVYLNGVFLGSSDAWAQASRYRASLQVGENVLAIKGIDAGGIAAIIADLTWDTRTSVSDSQWKVSNSAQAGWTQVGFDDSQWQAATSYGRYGVGPWLKRIVGFPANSTAQWIWTRDNDGDNTAYLRFRFNVQAQGVQINTATLGDGTVATNYSESFEVSGATPPISWSVSQGSLPEGLSLDPASGILAGIPSLASDYQFSITAIDNTGQSASRDYQLTIAEAPLSLPDITLVISGDNAERTYLNGELLGTSTQWSDSRTYRKALRSGHNVIAVEGTDAGGAAALIAQLNWDGKQAVSGGQWKVSTTPEAGWTNTSFDDSAWAAATSYGQYGVAPWLQRINGFPIDSPAQWIWTGDNQGDDTAYFRYSITVAAAGLSITETAPSGAVIAQTYQHQLQATGGALPYSWSVSDGTLPEGLSLDPSTGTLYGTPSLAGSYNFTISVIDNSGASAQRAFTVNVDTSASPIDLTITLSADNAEEAYLNGDWLGASNSWNEASTYIDAVQPGSNLLAVKATDAGGVAAFIAELSWAGQLLVSQGQWKVSTVEEAGWESPGFDDSAWTSATDYGRYGIGPWFKRVLGLPTDSTAHWIWSSDADRDNTVYLRFRFDIPSQ